MNPVYWLGTALLISLSFQSWILPALVGIVALSFCGLALLHEKGRLPPELVGVTGLMSILDRLTNKMQLQSLLTPKAQVQGRVQIDFERARQVMQEEIVGYTSMINDILSRVELAHQKIKRNRPVAVFMLAGPPATGKTEVGHALSRALFGNQVAYRIPGETLGYGASSVLTGAPPGTVNSDKSSSLVQFLIAMPNSVVIVDEFEKASPEVRDMFLGAWNDGAFPNHSQGGSTVDTTGVIFIVTTNAAQTPIAQLSESHEGREGARDEISDRCRELLKPTFGDALLSRVTCIYPMRPLAGIELATLLLKIVEAEIGSFGLQLVHVTPQVLAGYVQEATNRGATARTMRAKIEEEIGRQAGELQKAEHHLVTIRERDGQVLVEPYREPSAPKAPAKPRAK